MFFQVPIIILALIIIPIGLSRWIKSIKDKPWKNMALYSGVAGFTLSYWLWESGADGNIRVDLLLIYPFLFTVYLVLLWPRLRWFAVLATFALMAINFAFFIYSYELFGKNIG